MSEMNTLVETVPEPAVITDQAAADLSKSGHWAETQVIEAIKDASMRNTDPIRVLDGRATQPIGGIFHPVANHSGSLHIPKPTLRVRLKRLFGYLRG